MSEARFSCVPPTSGCVAVPAFRVFVAMHARFIYQMTAAEDSPSYHHLHVRMQSNAKHCLGEVDC